MKIDKTDRRILAELQVDASIALETLGERVGLSRNACWRRVKALESSGVILSRVALLDGVALEVPLTVFIEINAPGQDESWAGRFAKEASAFPEILGVYRMTGAPDYLLRAQVADVAGFEALRRRLTDSVEIRALRACFVTEHIKDSTALPV